MNRLDYPIFKPFTGVVKVVEINNTVRVRVFGIHNMEDNVKVSDNDLPLAIVSYPTTGGQAGSGNASHNLSVGSWVHGFFVDGENCQQPVVIGVFPGGDGAGSVNTTGKGNSTVTDSKGNPIVGADITNATRNIPGGSNIEKTYNYFRSKVEKLGDTNAHLHSSAWVGGLLVETGSINPAVVGGYKGRAWGIAQWLGTRRTRLFRTYGKTKDLSQQLDFMWWELMNTEKPRFKMMMASKNMPDAVAAMSLFERAEDYRKNSRGTFFLDRNHKVYKRRLKKAYEIYNSIKYTPSDKALTPSNTKGLTS